MAMVRKDGNKIRIVRVITRLNIGGPAIHTILLTEGINKEIFETHLVAGMPDASEGDLSGLARRQNISVDFIPELGREISFKDITAFVKLLKILLKVRPDIIHTHTAKAGTLGRLAAILAGVPVRIHTFHGHIFDGYFSPVKTKFFLAIEKFLGVFTDRVVVVSEKVRSEIVDKLKVVPGKKCIVLKLGFDLKDFLDNDRFKGALKKKLGIAPDVMLIGIVGRLVPIKNHTMFLAVAGKVIAGMPDERVKFLIIGDGELRQSLAAAAARMGLADKVIFTGWIRDTAKIYADLDIVVLTSLNEGTPVSLIEAMASAKPVVATDVGGVADIVKDGGNGLLFGADDIEGFARGVSILIKDRQKRSELGAAGREFVRNTFHKDRLIKEMEDLYMDCLRRKNKIKYAGGR
ncbi:MAG: glycosyltransferase family 4 protein [Candidatus Omnitrophota bacterium]